MMKIGNLTVEQYVTAIRSIKYDEVPDENDQPKFSFYESFAYAKALRGKRGSTWNQFCAILVMFQYLYYDVLNNPNLYQTALTMPSITGIAAKTSGENFTFGDNRVFRKVTNPIDHYKPILEAYTKRDCVADVLCRLYLFVDKDDVRNENNQSKFKQLAMEGFGVNVDDKLIKNQCQRMYEAGVKQIVITGAPGTGKTYTVEKFAQDKIWKEHHGPNSTPTEEDKDEAQKLYEKHIRKVQFHSSYDYSDFVEGLRPVMSGENMVFVRMDGQFKEFCREIIKDGDDSPYFFIIDEINRADLSRVFGELMYCLDEDNREKGVPTQYSNLPTYEIDGDKPKPMENDAFATGFYIPKNLCILATMNDIDRSVEAFDFALRRRFKWIEADAILEADPALHSMLDGKITSSAVDELVKKIKVMNEVIAPSAPLNSDANVSLGKKLGLSPAYHIGHAYFKTYGGTLESLQTIWYTQIEPILKEYCRGKNPKDTNDFINACNAALLQ